MKEEIPHDFYNKVHKYLDKFETYSLWNIVKSIPKTSIFHIHSDVCCKPKWILELMHKFKDRIYFNKQNKFYYYFEKGVPEDSEYVLVEKERQESEDPSKFDQ